MNKTNVSAALHSLATGDQYRSETARLRDVIDDVEFAIRAGVTHAAILATLHDQGFNLTAKSFESALYRLRKQQKQLSTGHSARLPPMGLAQNVADDSAPGSLGSGGITMIERVLAAPPPHFSFKQQQKLEKDKK